MAEILTHVFRTFMSPTDPKRDLAVGPPPRTCGTLVIGEPSLSRSVLLLAAVTAASQTGMKVMFFAQTQIQSLPASLQKRVPSLSLSLEALKKIKFSYPRTLKELLQQMASLHESFNTSPTPPSLIIIDRLEGFLCDPGDGNYNGVHPGEQSCAAHLSALLFDTAAFLTQVLEKQTSSLCPCRVIASFQSDVESGQTGWETSATDPILDILDRYFQVRCTLEQVRGYEAVAAGLHQLWHIYFSGRCITEAACTKDCEGRAGVAQEWQLLIFPNGLMEFKLV